MVGRGACQKGTPPLPTNNPILLADVTSELARLRYEVEGLLVALDGRRPQGAVLERVHFLHARYQALRTTINCFACEEMAYEVAFRERTGRNYDENSDEITAEDERRACEILAIFGLNRGDR